MNKKYAILTMEKFECRAEGSVGSSRIRGNWVVKYWDEAEIYQIGKKYEAVIFQKCYWLDFVKEYKGIKILDVCDIEDWNSGKRVKEMIENCDAVTTSTKALQENVQQFTDKPVVLVPDRIDFEEHKKVKQKHEGILREVAWFGYSHNFTILKPCVPALQKKEIKFKVISDKEFSHAQINIIPKPWVTAEVHKELIKSDAALMPEYNTGKFLYKSNNKTLTCWALKLPVITTPEELEKFKHGDVRQKEAEEKYKLVKEKFDVSLSGIQYKKLIEQIKNDRKKSSKN